MIHLIGFKRGFKEVGASLGYKSKIYKYFKGKFGL